MYWPPGNRACCCCALCWAVLPQAVEEAIASMEYQLTHESLSAEREKMIREKKERAEKHDRPAAMRLAQVGPGLTLVTRTPAPAPGSSTD